MTWASRERPILEAILAIEEAGKDRMTSVDLAAAVGLAEAEAIRGINALEEAGYVAWSSRAGVGRSKIYLLPRLLERGRREVGQWPSDGFDALIRLLDERIKAEPEPVEKGRLERFRSAVLDLGRDVLADVLSRAIGGGLGLPE